MNAKYTESNTVQNQYTTSNYKSQHNGIADRQTDRQTPVYQPLLQDNLGKPAPERINQSGF